MANEGSGQVESQSGRGRPHPVWLVSTVACG